MTSQAEKKIRLEQQPSYVAMVAAAAEAKVPTARVESIFDRVPKDIVLQCIGFLDMVSVRQGLAVRALRKAAGGQEPPSHMAIKELHMTHVVAEEFAIVSIHSPQLLTYVCLWRRHVETLDAREAGWIFCKQFNDGLKTMDTIVFPRLTTLRLGIRNIGGFVATTLETILEQCPKLDRFELVNDPYDLSISMNAYSDWQPALERTWRSMSVPLAVDPKLYLDLANPSMTALEFHSGHWNQRNWTVDEIRQLCMKWDGHGDRLQRLALGNNFNDNDIDEIAQLLLRHFPNLERLPWPRHAKLSEDIIPLLMQTTRLRSLELMNTFPQNAMDAKTLATILSQNTDLEKVWVWPCTVLSDALLQRVLITCPKLHNLRLGCNPTVECKLSAKTLTDLAQRIPLVELDFGIVTSLDADAVFALAEIVCSKRHVLQLYLPDAVVRTLIVSGQASDMHAIVYQGDFSASFQAIRFMDLVHLGTNYLTRVRLASVEELGT